jgi:hypothetical protein
MFTHLWWEYQDPLNVIPLKNGIQLRSPHVGGIFFGLSQNHPRRVMVSKPAVSLSNRSNHVEGRLGSIQAGKKSSAFDGGFLFNDALTAFLYVSTEIQ